MTKTMPLIGKGKLTKFVEDYLTIQLDPKLRVVASTLFPSGATHIESNTEFTECYEYVIYYEVGIFSVTESKPQPKAAALVVPTKEELVVPTKEELVVPTKEVIIEKEMELVM